MNTLIQAQVTSAIRSGNFLFHLELETASVIPPQMKE